MCCKINNITHINIINTNNRLYAWQKYNHYSHPVHLHTHTHAPYHHIILSILGINLKSVPIAPFCLVTETKGHSFRRISGFHSTSGYIAVIFSTHLVTMKCEVFTTTSTTTTEY